MKVLNSLGAIHPFGEICRGIVYKIVERTLLVDLDNGGSCELDLPKGINGFQVGDAVEVIFAPKNMRICQFQNSFEWSMRSLKKRLGNFSFDDECKGKVLAKGERAILVIFDEEQEIIGRYLTPSQIMPEHLKSIKVGDTVLCRICDSFISDMVKSS